jgi:hypothetical protein
VKRRFGAALLALACLLPQVALAVHHHEHEAAEEACGCGDRAAIECGNADCGSKEHHHHERAHDPATCRTCTNDVAPILEAIGVRLVTSVDVFEPAERAHPGARPIDLWRSGRGPPV